MRVLHLDSGREMRGGQWQVLRLHRGLLEQGIDSMLLAHPASPLAGAAARDSLPCANLSGFRVATESRKYDLVHAHDARSHTLAAVFSSQPIVVSRRVAFPVKRSIVSRWKYRRPTRFLAVSRFVAEELARGGVSANRIDVVYDGVPVPDNAASGIAILTPRSTDPGKCMELALAAAKEAGIPLIPSGNLEKDLPRSQGLVYLSTSEGLGSGILLAMAHGLTVVASRVGGIPELIEDDVTGILTENNIPSIVAALERMDRRLGTAARLRVMERFTVRHMIAATLESYRRA